MSVTSKYFFKCELQFNSIQYILYVVYYSDAFYCLLELIVYLEHFFRIMYWIHFSFLPESSRALRKDQRIKKDCLAKFSIFNEPFTDYPV